MEKKINDNDSIVKFLKNVPIQLSTKQLVVTLLKKMKKNEKKKKKNLKKIWSNQTVNIVVKFLGNVLWNDLIWKIQLINMSSSSFIAYDV